GREVGGREVALDLISDCGSEISLAGVAVESPPQAREPVVDRAPRAREPPRPQSGMGLLVACRKEVACGVAHRRARRLGAVGSLLLLLVVGLQRIALGAQDLDELLELVGPLLRLSQATIEHLGARVRDGVLALEPPDPEPLLDGDACVVLADMRLPLPLGGQPRVRR